MSGYFKRNGKKNYKEMVKAAYYSGKAINVSKTTLPHALSYFFTARYNIPHGHAVALTLGFLGRLNVVNGNNKLKKTMKNIADILEIDVKNFEIFWYDLMKKVNLETSLTNLGVQKDDLELIIDSVNVERLKNHPLHIEKKVLIKEFKKLL